MVKIFRKAEVKLSGNKKKKSVKFLLFIVTAVSIFQYSPSSFAEISFFDLKGIHKIIEKDYRNTVSPVYGFTSLKTKLIENIRFNGKLGRESDIYPCHLQIPKESRHLDCPQDWTTAMVQFLFPSPDGRSFTPNQGSTHDPLSHLQPEVIGQILDLIQKINLDQLKSDTAYFAKVRRDLVDLVYFSAFKKKEETPKRDLVHPDLQGQKLSTIYERESEKAISACGNSVEYLDHFRNVHEEISKLVSIVDHVSGKEHGLTRSLMMKRRVSEDFANSVLGAVLESMNERSPYPKNTPQLALLTYFWKKKNSREDVLSLFKKVPHFLKSKYRSWVNPDSEKVQEDKRKWLEDHYTKADYLQWREAFLAPLPEIQNSATRAIVSDPEFLAFVAHSYDFYESYYPPYVSYGVSAHPSLNKGGIYTHPNCGETSLELLLNSFLYNREPLDSSSDNYYNVELLKEMAQRHLLKPYHRIGEDGVEVGLIPFYTRNSQPRKSTLDEVRDDFSQHVVSNLNLDYPDDDPSNIHYIKPTQHPVCELHPGLDNLLNAVTRQLGDYEEVGALSRLTTRADKLNRLCQLFSTQNVKWAWHIKGTGKGPKEKEARNSEVNHGPDFGFTLVFSGSLGQKIEIDFQKKHFAIKFGKEPLKAWKRAFGPQMIKALLSQAKLEGTDSNLTNLGWFLDRNTFKEITKGASHQLLKERALPYVIYSSHFDTPKVVTSIFDFVVKNQLEEFYPAATLWPRRIPANSSARQTQMIETLVQNMDQPRIRPLIQAAVDELPLALHISAEINSSKWVHELGELGKLTPERILERRVGERRLLYPEYQRSPLLTAVDNRDVDLVRFLIHAGKLTPEQILQQDGFSGSEHTILHQAIANSNTPMIRMILDEIQSPEIIENSVNWQLRTPLHSAVLSNDPEVVQLLFDRGKITASSLLKADKYGETALHIAARQSNVKMIEALFHNAQLTPDQTSIQDKNGRTPLHNAILFVSGRETPKNSSLIQTIIMRLVRLGNLTANHLSLPDLYGETPLHLAAKFGNIRALEVILGLGILSPEQISLENKEGKTAFQLAANPESRKLLIQYLDKSSLQKEMSRPNIANYWKDLLLQEYQKRR